MKVKVQISITDGKDRMVVLDEFQVELSGDRRRHKAQVAAACTAAFTNLVGALAIRFGKEGWGAPVLAGRANGRAS